MSEIARDDGDEADYAAWLDHVFAVIISSIESDAGQAGPSRTCGRGSGRALFEYTPADAGGIVFAVTMLSSSWRLDFPSFAWRSTKVNDAASAALDAYYVLLDLDTTS
jgi:hypothetical protein